VSEKVLVGLETPDDAGVYQIDAERAIIQTLDFFTPIVDDPYEYGQIAAANSLSDVYAMGGVPLTAMNIVCFPMDSSPKEWLVEILRGGADKVQESGAILLGGHTVNDEIIKFGLSVTGMAHPSEITAVKGARAGDDLVLTKAVGTGIVTTALKRGIASEAAVAATVDSMRTLNAAAARAMVRVGVHAATDVTGFALLGHLFEMLEASGVAANVDSRSVPFLPGALEYAAQGVDTGGGKNNRAFLGDRVALGPEVSPAAVTALFDPQTSGGLLISVAPEKTERLLAELESESVPIRAVIGRIVADTPGTIRVS
jgi:selenide,water dikinase